jgi:hypothetical protein
MGVFRLNRTGGRGRAARPACRVIVRDRKRLQDLPRVGQEGRLDPSCAMACVKSLRV